MRIGEKLVNNYFENENFDYSEINDNRYEYSKIFSFGFRKQKIDTTMAAFENYNMEGIWDSDLIYSLSWGFKYLYSIFLLGESYEKIGDELNSKKYFTICKKLLLEDYFMDDYNLDSGEEIELQNILNHNIDYIKSKIQS